MADTGTTRPAIIITAMAMGVATTVEDPTETTGLIQTAGGTEILRSREWKLGTSPRRSATGHTSCRR